MAREMNDETKELIRKVEVKRAGERITKKELCNIYGLHYNFYMNCLNGSNAPSAKMIDAFRQYVYTSKAEVYKLLFDSRKEEDKFHPSLKLTKKDVKKIKDELKAMEEESIVNSYNQEPSV